MTAPALPRLAVLIDGENVSPAVADALFAAAHQRGSIAVRRVYGDWQRSSVGGWRDAAGKWAIETVQQCTQQRGDGASDVRIAIDAVDLLYTGRIDGFCLVSGDGDFAPLAQRIRKSNLPVYGFGPAHAAATFRASCTEFVALKKLAPPAATAKAKLAAGCDSTLPPIDPEVIELLVDGVRQLADADGWVSLAHLGAHLHRNVPGYSHAKLGAASLSRALRRSGVFEVVTKHAGSGVVRLVAPHLAQVDSETAAS